ncbi:MAG: hypothetical protein JST39_09915 [Bacteroidetes bacterium]|nr:hypothetical protein [Bacteroidota bacterium]
MAIHVLGIRHHGPGSARSVKAFLEETKPDIVLVEGPPEGDEILQWADHNELKPPLAILAYQSDNIQQSVFYPFAEFSPEWQAIQYAKKNKIHLRFMDLPLAHVFAMEQEKKAATADGDAPPAIDESPAATGSNALRNDAVEATAEPEIKRSAMSWLAEAAGYSDEEKWWEHMFEHRVGSEPVFDAVTEAMQALRSELPQKEDRIEQLREASMRRAIRQAEKEMFASIAVICGAWHAPALVNMPKQKEDNDLLKGLPKVKVTCTWVPWTYSRLSFHSGYGAGIESPGWYSHIWKYPNDDGTRWMAKVASLFRKKQMDTSVAHIIEAVRLAQSLAALRDLPKAGLEELNEATLSVLCNGEQILMQLIHDELIVSNKIGNVPADIPRPPLQVDIEKWQKKLRLPATADWKDYTLDLRKENDLERSVFLHRLSLLELKWGHRSEVGGKGTFKEQWRLQWDPSFVIDIIEKGPWGNTTEEAATGYVLHKAKEEASLQLVCGLLEQTIPAEMPKAVKLLIEKINNLSATSADVVQLMEVVPPLVNVSRYGNVRKTDSEMVTGIAAGIITRICVSLPNACMGVADDAAQHLLELFFKMNDAVSLLQHADITQQWQQTLQYVSGGRQTAPVIAGYSTRLLADYKILQGDELVKVFYYAMSGASAPMVAAAWLEGFLKGSGTLLLIDEGLWTVVDNWVAQLDETIFTQVLPLLRRTVSQFSAPERKKLGEKVKQGAGGKTMQIAESSFDAMRAAKGLPLIMQMMGYTNKE